MTLEILSVLGSGGSSGTDGSDTTTSSSGSSGTGSSSETSGTGQTSGTSGSGSAGQAETAYAVAPTPVTAAASKADFTAEKSNGSTVFEYPISGPDKFARAVAEQARMESEQQQIVEAIEESPEVQDIGIDPEELRGPEKDDEPAMVDNTAKDETEEVRDQQAASVDTSETSVFVATPDDGNE